MTRLRKFLAVLLFCLPVAPQSQAQDGNLLLFVDPVLLDSGVAKFILPRFSLKTGVRIDVKTLGADGVVPNGADLVLSSAKLTGSRQFAPMMAGFNQVFNVASPHGANADGSRAKKSARFIKWALSDTGQRTVEQFKNGDVHPFKGAANMAEQMAPTVYAGDAAIGETLSYKNCGRCHVIGHKNRMKGLGSTPSFALLRTFDDWQYRFEAFYVLNPHPSFSQVQGITAPFDARLPPPISPLRVTPGDLENIVAFVATIQPADLGAPIVHQ